MNVKNIKKIGITQKLILIGLMQSFGALTYSAAAETVSKNELHETLINEVKKYQHWGYKIGNIGRFGRASEYEKELLLKLEQEYPTYYEILKKENAVEKLDELLGIEAAHNNVDSIQRIELLIDAKAEVNFCRTFDEAAPLLIAAEKGHKDIVDCLLSHCAHVDQPRRNRNEETPLFVAAHNGHVAVVESLVQHRANIDLVGNKDRKTALFIAAKKGHVPVVESLLKHCARVDQTSCGRTPFSVAVENGNLPVVECFLTNNPEVDQTEYFGKTSFFIAIEEGHTDIVTCLENAGEKIIDLEKVLLKAIARGKIRLVDYLIGKRADVNYIPKDDFTALYCAAYHGFWAENKNIVKHLIAAGARIDVAGPEGVTPLFVAIEKEYPEIVSVLLDAHCLQPLAPFCLAVKNIDAIMKQQEKNSSSVCAGKDARPALTTAEISPQVSGLEQLPIECLWIIMENLSSQSIARFRQSSRTCRNAAGREYELALKRAIALKQQDFMALVERGMAYIKNKEDRRAIELRNTAIVELLQAAAQRDFWQEAVKAQPVCVDRGVISDAQYAQSCAEHEESCAEKNKKGDSRCAIS